MPDHNLKKEDCVMKKSIIVEVILYLLLSASSAFAADRQMFYGGINGEVGIFSSQVGIGTTGPGVMLNVGDNIGTLTGSVTAIGDVNGNGELTIGQSSTGRGQIYWNYNAVEDDAYFGIGTVDYTNNPLVLMQNGGNVGIGTTLPVTKADINGAIRLSTDATACSASIRGAIRYTAGGAGVADTFDACTKSAADVYAWRAIYTAP